MKHLLFCVVLSAAGFAAQAQVPADVDKLLKLHSCTACHKVNDKLIGPSYMEVAKRKYKPEQIVALIYEPKASNWPKYPPMAAMPQVPRADALKIANWIAGLK